MSALEPGPYKATVRGVPDVTVMVRHDGWGDGLGLIAGHISHSPSDITDARPLIVLDLAGDDLDTLINLRRDLCAALRSAADECFPKSRYPHDLLSIVADQVEVQIPKPARIPEPGKWGVVEASTTEHKRCVFIRDTTGDGASWITPYFFPHDSTRRAVGWADLIDPTLVREGLS